MSTGDAKPLAPGDSVFVHHAHRTDLWCKVQRVTPDEITLYVVNGAYELHLTRAKPPGCGHPDYNEAIAWFDRVEKPRRATAREVERAKERVAAGDYDEVIF